MPHPKILLAAFALVGSAALPLAASAQDSSRYGSRTDSYNRSDMDRHGRGEYDRGYRMGRDDERTSSSRYGSRHSRSEGGLFGRDEFERGYRFGRFEEREEGGRYGRRDD